MLIASKKVQVLPHDQLRHLLSQAQGYASEGFHSRVHIDSTSADKRIQVPIANHGPVSMGRNDPSSWEWKIPRHTERGGWKEVRIVWFASLWPRRMLMGDACLEVRLFRNCSPTISLSQDFVVLYNI